MFFFFRKFLAKKLILSICLISISIAAADIPDPLSPLLTFFNQEKIPKSSWPQLTYVNKNNLPSPYDFLLTQPLMTLGIEQYYQRTAKVRTPLYTIANTTQSTYSRAIIMIVDPLKSRDDALAADRQGQSIIAELGLITMNFRSLPQPVINGVLHSQTPFGKLLTLYKVKTHPVNQSYFQVPCSPVFSNLLQCQPGETIYGRLNTLVRDDNGQWVAHTVEILTGIKNQRES